MTEPSAGTTEKSGTIDQPAEVAKKLKSSTRKPKRYIAPEKGRDWYEKAGGKIAIKRNAKRAPQGRT